ncbi:MAG: hypothetical protein ACO3N7_01655 [Kiritimatiellia bacterium]
MDALTLLLPTFITQILMGVLLLWLFVMAQDEIDLDRILLTSLLYTLLNVLIEWFLKDYLLATTLVFQWTIFVLLANRICAIPLPRASITLFCFFSLLMGGRMLEAHFFPEEISEEEKLLMEGFHTPRESPGAEVPELSWVQRIREGSIASKTYVSKKIVVDLIYGGETENEDPLSPPPATPTPLSVKVEPSPLPPSTGTLSGKEFEALFYPLEYSSESEQSPPPAVPTPLPAALLPPPRYADTNSLPPPSGPASINAEQLTQIVEIRNHSTDPAYAAPDFQISAVSMGSNGRFAIVDGDMLREGSIIHTQLDTPRAWMLYRIEPTKVFWRPLK